MTQLPQLVPTSGFDSGETYDKEMPSEADQIQFRREIEPLLFGISDTDAKVLVILNWVMNQFSVVDSHSSIRSSWKMVELGRKGVGFSCGTMSHVFRDALRANGIVARRVILYMDVFDAYDGHVTVEAWVNGKWRLYDPTFHVSVRANGERVGAAEARDWFVKGTGDKVDIEYLGDVRYPARTTRYPFRYEVLFKNMYVEVDRSYGLIRGIPIAGYAFAPRWLYVMPDKTFSTSPQEAYRIIYTLAIIVFPGIAVVLWLVLAAAYAYMKWQRRRLPRNVGNRQTELS